MKQSRQSPLPSHKTLNIRIRGLVWDFAEILFSLLSSIPLFYYYRTNIFSSTFDTYNNASFAPTIQYPKSVCLAYLYRNSFSSVYSHKHFSSISLSLSPWGVGCRRHINDWPEILVKSVKARRKMHIILCVHFGGQCNSEGYFHVNSHLSVFIRDLIQFMINNAYGQWLHIYKL